MKWNNGNDKQQPSASATGVASRGLRTLGFGFGRDDESREEIERIDFKMVTFSLAGKDYGIDIMKVKEIAKFERFTFVPNARPFVAGVYNLRGEIISIIDLRVMFNLPAEQHSDGTPQDGLILRLEDNLIGVIVDRIDRVVGISSESIQPPHPIFADINIRYISGVVEHEDRLYITLDVDRIFTKESEKARAVGQSRRVMDTPPGEPIEESASVTAPAATAPDEQQEFSFISDGLATFQKLYASAINLQWLQQRFKQWRQERSEAQKPIQFADEHDAAAFVRPFFSANSEQVWDRSYSEALRAVLPHAETMVVNAWNPGCAKGHESYSLAAVLSTHYSGRRVKIWAGDNDLLSISTAPNLILAEEAVPDYMQEFTIGTANGVTFSAGIKEMILFEYHDIRHESGVPDVHIVVCRDLLSLLEPEVQQRVLTKFYETLVNGGVLIVGDNEQLNDDTRWQPVSDQIQAYRKV